MTSTNVLLDKAKEALGLESDYALAKALEVNNGTIAGYRKGTRQPDAYAAARLALALGRDPLELIAEIEAEHARTPTARAWWRTFLSSGLKSTVNTVAALLICIGTWSAGGQAQSPSGLFRRRVTA
jgi:hypothetical protein